MLSKLIYAGCGFVPGIPARDLTADEVKKYGGEKYLIATGLYRRDLSQKKEGKK